MLCGLLAVAEARVSLLRRGATGEAADGVAVKTPMYSRSGGVRAGVMSEEPKFEPDGGTFGRNKWFGDSMSLKLDVMDNLDPVAPMDRIASSKGVSTVEGRYRNALYVAPYLVPDAFPSVEGPTCECTPGVGTAAATCKCDPDPTNSKVAPAQIKWMKDTPSASDPTKYTLKPADLTYSSGDYWHPKIQDGIVAPEDRLPRDSYPNQAKKDAIVSMPVAAREDTVPKRFARYIDQVEARSRECDTVSPECTVACAPGDQVMAGIGNTLVASNIISTHVGNAVKVKMPILAAENAALSVDCKLESDCTLFRFCFKVDQNNKPVCVAQEDKKEHDVFGNLVVTHACPSGATVCKSVEQFVSGDRLKKGDKACRAAV